MLVGWTIYVTPISGETNLPELKKVAEPRLKSIYSEVHQVSEFLKPNTKAIVLVFMGTQCPVIAQYAPRLVELSDKYQPKGVQFLGIYSNVGDDVLRMALHAQRCDFPFPPLIDTEHRLADRYQIEVMSEVVVVDRDLKVRYQGAIDNQFKKRGTAAQATQHYLEDALNQFLSNQTVELTHTLASGCKIERREPPVSEQPVTYHKDVAPILQKHCQVCHRAGEVGPFTLTSYRDAFENASMIEETAVERRMPPWHGVLNPKFGDILGDKRMSNDEIETITSWVRQGAKEGDRAETSPPIQWPAATSWGIGKPDFVYKMPAPFKVPATGTLDYQFIRVPLNFPEDRWFRASETKPGNPQVVHHIGLHIVESGDREYNGFAGMAVVFGLNGETSRELNDYVPGDPYNHKVYADNEAVRLPKGTDLLFEVHYTPNGKATTDQSMVAVRWAKSPPEEEILTRVFRKKRGGFKIPPHEGHYRMDDVYYFEQDVLIDSIRPHLHARGKSYQLDIVYRDPKTDEIERRETILAVPNFDFRWQRTYELKTPLRVPAGAELLATAHFDNSELNPNNPNPNAEVLWGLQSADEMFSSRFRYRLAK